MSRTPWQPLPAGRLSTSEPSPSPDRAEPDRAEPDRDSLTETSLTETSLTICGRSAVYSPPAGIEFAPTRERIHGYRRRSGILGRRPAGLSDQRLQWIGARRRLGEARLVEHRRAAGSAPR